MNLWKNFELGWLKAGMWVTTRNGLKGLIVTGTTRGNIVIFLGGGNIRGWAQLDADYDSGGLYLENEDRDIVAVYKPDSFGIIPCEDSSLRWQRAMHKVVVDHRSFLMVSKRAVDAILELLK